MFARDLSSNPAKHVYEVVEEEKEGLLHNTISDAASSFTSGCLQLLLMLGLTSVLILLAHVSCIYVWGIMVLSIILMLFCSMPSLWVVTAASFIVSFYVGCQAGCEWITVSTKFHLP